MHLVCTQFLDSDGMHLPEDLDPETDDEVESEDDEEAGAAAALTSRILNASITTDAMYNCSFLMFTPLFRRLCFSCPFRAYLL
jgi:hypothetical protein